MKIHSTINEIKNIAIREFFPILHEKSPFGFYHVRGKEVENNDESFLIYKIDDNYTFKREGEFWYHANLKNMAGVYGSFGTKEETRLAAKEYFKNNIVLS